MMVISSDTSRLGSFVEALPSVYLEPMLTGTVAGLFLGFLGVYVILKRMVFISAALSQVSGVGVALAFYLQIHLGVAGLLGEPILIALLLSIAATFLFQLDPKRIRLTRDSVLGLSYVIAGGLVLVLGTRISQEAHDISSILFGTAVAVRPLDMWLIVGLGIVLVVIHALVVRGLAAVTFDPVGSQAQGLPVRSLDMTLFFSIAVAVAVTTRALGALPVFALTVLPAMAALALAKRLGLALVLAGLFGALAGMCGYAYAHFVRLPVGASQTVVAGVFAVLAMCTKVALSRETRVHVKAAVGATVVIVATLTMVPLVSPGGPGAHTHGHTGQGAAPPVSKGVEQASLPGLLEILAADKDPLKRADAADRVGKLKLQGATRVLLTALSDEAWEVRAAATEALGRIGGPEICQPLVTIASHDTESFVRSAAVAALGECDGTFVRQRLTEIARSDPDTETRTAAEAALQQRGGGSREWLHECGGHGYRCPTPP